MSRNCFRDRYKERLSLWLANGVSLSLATVPWAFAKVTRPSSFLVSKVTNGRLSHFLRENPRGWACFTEKVLTVSDPSFLSFFEYFWVKCYLLFLENRNPIRGVQFLPFHSGHKTIGSLQNKARHSASRKIFGPLLRYQGRCSCSCQCNQIPTEK